MEAAPAAPFRPSVSEGPARCGSAGPLPSSPSWSPWTVRKGAGEEESVRACPPTSLVSPFLALPPLLLRPALPPSLGWCVCVFVCALAPVGAKEDKLVAGLLSPFSHPGDFPFPPSHFHPGALYQLSSEQVELTLPQPTPIPISPNPARLPEPEAKKLHQTHEVTTQT